MAYIQIRHDNGAIHYVSSLKDAFKIAKDEISVWKISFDWGKERVRLVRSDVGDKFYYESIELGEE